MLLATCLYDHDQVRVLRRAWLILAECILYIVVDIARCLPYLKYHRLVDLLFPGTSDRGSKALPGSAPVSVIFPTVRVKTVPEVEGFDLLYFSRFFLARSKRII